MMAAQDLPKVSDAGHVPEWIHLAPNGAIETFDGRGPYEIQDPQAVIEASFAARGEIEIDVNHASFTAAKAGGEAPARGWITEMQSRDDGIWGRVRWTAVGEQLVADRAYRRISPVFQVASPDKPIVTAILNASLVNRQNLRGLTALNHEQEEPMGFLGKLAAYLGLGADASEDQIMAAVKKMKGGSDTAIAAQSQLNEVATVLGIDAGGDVVAAAKTHSGGAAGVVAMQQAVTELQGLVAQQSETINTLTGTQSKTAAATFIDGEIKKGRVIPAALRDHYITMHQEDAARVEKEISAMPMLNSAGAAHLTPPSASSGDGSVAMQAEDTQAARLLGLTAEDMQAVRKDEQNLQGDV